MGRVYHKGYCIENTGDAEDGWKIRIKNRVLTGHLAAVKKSIDWWCDTASIIDPSELGDMGAEAKAEKEGKKQQEEYLGYNLRNDTGEPKEWYVMHGGQLVKGSLKALKGYIDKLPKKE
ncbi:DUF3319 domain-containing protein [Vibrio sp. Of7-15]|uniref:DUF3319 domain-containing protein n=1 Tax=Vibrio sp. Of7-15 TaxID=2724879 RepID=UPI001EF2128A|nr:DUF3319 domain-containing protein [Vibrio sp. Of7-15]MCG7495722.1 DUF3319 domain-containing protein [Vibrio sp. Of7-15]